MEALLNRILDRLDQLQSDINTLTSEVNDVKTKMATKQEAAELRSTVNELQFTMNQLQSTVNEMEAKMATKQELAELRSTVNEMEAKMATKDDLAPIRQAVLETNEIVKNIEVNQERHEQILEILSKRSIEHEASISKLRRAQ